MTSDGRYATRDRECQNATLNAEALDRDDASREDDADRPRLGCAARRAIAFPRLRPRSTRRAPSASNWLRSHYENFHVATWFLAQGAAPAFSLDLRLLPHLRRSGRRSRRHRSGAGAARSVGPGTRRLLRGPRAPSGLCRAGRDHSRLLHSQGAVRRSARRVSPGPDRHALRDHGRCARLLPLLGESRGPAGALRLRRSETKKTSGSPTRPAPRCNWPTSGRMCAWTSPRTASICRRTTCSASA